MLKLPCLRPRDDRPSMPIPKLGPALYEVVSQNFGTTIASDGITKKLPDGRTVEINNVSVMLERLSGATSAQAVHQKEFFEKIEMKKVSVAVNVVSDKIESAEQHLQWFDADGMIVLTPPEKKMKQ